MSRIYGVHAITDLLDAAPQAISLIAFAPSGLRPEEQQVVARARDLGLPVRQVDLEALRARSGARGGARVAADVRVAEPPELEALAPAPGTAPVILAVDGVTDPHNLGAIIRSASALGALAVVVPRHGTAPLNDAAARASAGAIAWTPVLRVTNLGRTIRTLADLGYWSVATEIDAEATLWESDLSGPVVIAVGSEGRGLRHGVRRACDRALRLPLGEGVTSLNVSVFAGIVLAEAARQRAGAPPSSAPAAGPESR